jgi:predicted rRNA methylase YqxC with S4 and FtsJ domains
MSVGLTQILLSRKMKKIYAVDSAAKMDGEDLKKR